MTEENTDENRLGYFAFVDVILEEAIKDEVYDWKLTSRKISPIRYTLEEVRKDIQEYIKTENRNVWVFIYYYCAPLKYIFSNRHRNWSKYLIDSEIITLRKSDNIVRLYQSI
ncbi:MAG: hypothetical protein QW283_04445 [Thermoplasmata archaeon]